ncbi:hypothetical protein FM113_03785 [Leucobacter sp. 7(1)]|nr:hypothetical protein FM113_03785 [Leucobacter sp. 7(1)]
MCHGVSSGWGVKVSERGAWPRTQRVGSPRAIRLASAVLPGSDYQR